MSTCPPPSSAACRARARALASSPRSALTKSALPPAPRIVATTCSPRAASRPADAAVPAGHQRGLALQLAHVSCSLLWVVMSPQAAALAAPADDHNLSS